ncbi:sodium/glutamate symporter [Muriicola sp. Z0-33]|nr:sodium/glutamate symporter [Muriicola sp. Z0-33]
MCFYRDRGKLCARITRCITYHFFYNHRTLFKIKNAIERRQIVDTTFSVSSRLSFYPKPQRNWNCLHHWYAKCDGYFRWLGFFQWGHGTTIAWVPTFQNDFGISNAMEMGIACATIGLVLGGFIGGPIAKFLINKYDLKPKDSKPVTVGVRHDKEDTVEMNYNNVLQMIYFIFSTAGLGIGINELLVWIGLSLPSFVTALFAGIIITNLIPVFSKNFDWQPENSKALAMASDLSLGLFLAMSLMSLQLWTLADLAGPLLLIVIAQLVVISLFVIVVVFRVMGKDYDAAVMSAGYAGLSLGATPTAIANMTAVTKKFGGSPKAFIVVPLVGAFFIDISNALIIKFLLGVFG